MKPLRNNRIICSTLSVDLAFSPPLIKSKAGNAAGTTFKSHYKLFYIKDRNEMGARSSVFLARYAGRLVFLRDLWTLWVAQYLIPITPTASVFE